MKIKTSSSFFPTNVRPITPSSQLTQKSRTYKLIKRHYSVQPSPRSHLDSSHSNNNNIFTSQVFQQKSMNVLEEKPVGGIEIFMKEHVKKNGNQDIALARSSQQFSRQNKRQSSGKVSVSNDVLGFSQVSERKTGTGTGEEQKGEVFKKQEDYEQMRKSKGSGLKTKTRPMTSMSKKSAMSKKMTEWIDNQSKEYQTKMSIVAQSYYNRPLVDRYGDRYFEHNLRNRYEEDLPPPCYVHQIHSQAEMKKIGQNKFIKKLHQMGACGRSFQKLTIRGRRIQVQSDNN